MYKRKQTSCTKIEIPKTLRKLLLIYLCPWRKSRLQKMPKVRLGRSAGSGSARRRPPPEGWELIEPTLEELEGKMREAETESHEGKRKVNQRHSYLYQSKSSILSRPNRGIETARDVYRNIHTFISRQMWCCFSCLR